MRKARSSIRLERLERFITWASVHHPDFILKKNHQEKWFVYYASQKNVDIARAAKAFWLGLDEEAVATIFAHPETTSLIDRLLARDQKDYSCAVTVFGIEKTFSCGSIQNLLEVDWALQLPDSDSREAFTAHVNALIQRIVQERLKTLEQPLAHLNEEEKQLCLDRLHPDIARIDEFLGRVIDAINEFTHELRYVVELRRDGLALDVQRRIPSGQGHVLSAQEVEDWKAQDRQALENKFGLMLEAAEDFDLQVLGQKRLNELFMMGPDKLQRAIRFARAEYNEKMAFAVLLENNPRFVHYHKLYPARRLTRKWTALLGPTNSGKTHRSIEAMTSVKHGIYLSPLRLMALENQERIEAMGIPCSLVTGEEQIIREGATHFCCTVEEFARFRHQHWDVVVVDEVQMLADPQRGWAWVDALVSAHTPDLIMTGPALIEPSLKTLCDLCEDRLVVTRTKRLSPVDVSKHSTTLKHLDEGSMLVAFSRKTVLELKGLLETTGKTVSVVYGNLSPEVRREQARRFREGEADIMVATDAVGMGLNLPAHTLCFYTDEKFDGIQNRQLTVQEVKQIGGRAGRFGHHESGTITALEASTLKTIRRLFNSPDQPVDLSQFQVRPSLEHLMAISELMHEPSLLRAWLTFNRNINYGDEFISILPDELADWIRLIDDLNIPLSLRWIFACTPIRGGLESPASIFAQGWLKRVAASKVVDLPRLIIDADLATLESSLHIIETYLHLGRTLPDHFPHVEKGEEQRSLLNGAITRELSRRRKPGRIERRQASRSGSGARKVCKQCGKPMPLLGREFRLCDRCWREQKARS
ncbi:ATP-dependent RNA helicase SUPV3L1/SUV3 [Pseudomonas duriflava]|uniref:ATP-dependent RNA helicase SUPV3L1/SUV3 n=1 Tax=Pseudomonas duriflava TaxID=459528 RepID=A0A562QPS8_9PSED|nr:helicase-related protein [Pseudomonas duriflava]TWI58683.1 ATP-dependent RNA helicase SUPV3L1/SUV3 [Pseudomonas duriflava]